MSFFLIVTNGRKTNINEIDFDFFISISSLWEHV